MRGGRFGIAALLVGVLLGWMPGAAWAAGCRADTVYLKGGWGQVRFKVELADSAAERAQGLMNRTALANSAGVLIVYPHPQAVAFWMRNTLIPLDMLFIDEAGRVQHIHENAIPLDETPIPGGDDIRYVLEVNAGVLRQLGLTTGSVMRHPAVPSNLAVWPC